MYNEVFTILLLSNEYEEIVFTIYLWKSLFLPLFSEESAEREVVVWSDTCGQGLVPLIKKQSGGY